MRRRLFYSFGILAIVSGLILAGTITLSSEAKEKNKTNKRQKKVTINVTPVGPSQEEIDRVSAVVTRNTAVQKYLQGTRSRLLSFKFIEPDAKNERAAKPTTRFIATFYDYTNNRSVIAEGDFNDPSTLDVSESSHQPLPTDEEFEEAVRILEGDDTFGSRLRDKTFGAYRAMPPVLESPDKTTRVPRTIHIGLAARGTNDRSLHEVVGVNMITQRVVRYEKGAPPTCTAGPQACGIPDAGQSTTPRNTAGQYQLTVSQGQTTLWEMLVIRPSVSSGTRASGIEVRDVRYKGKIVMKRGHAPVLNVLYDGNACGPYRDWQYQEGQFQTPTGSTDPAPGVRVSPSQATTALDTGNDSGNFRGVAIYPYDNGTPTNTTDDETVLVTEMNAGWYRYIMEWRFANDGTIRPRFGFGATDNTCVCSRHHHHVYWRFDMDVAGTDNKVYQTEIPKKLSDRGGWQQITTEAKRNRSYPTKRSFIIQNASGPEAYVLTPNVTDGLRGGVDESYGSGDLWFLRYKFVSGGSNLQNEIDDGYNSTGGTCTFSGGNTTGGSCIHIDSFANSESLDGQDVVVWYGAHFIHFDGNNILNPSRRDINVLSGAHVVGPDLRPMNW
jgi:hypothetical protein